MKVTDLMVGDWVEFWRATPIGRIATQTKVEGYDIYRNAECCHPIPLTAEILSKNGFKETSLGSWLCGGEHNIILTEDEVHWWANIVSMIAAGEISLPINYVHELQHALRLFGIEKEIQL